MSNFDKIDVIVVARGGGSMEDLSAYNTERVARATFACNKPIISAVGHETDFTIIDFVSDLRAPTPSAAAELLTEDVSKRRTQFENLLFSFKNNIDKISFELTAKLQTAKENYVKNVDMLLRDREYELALLDKTLIGLDPKAILKRGYAKVEQNGKVVDKAKDIVLSSKLDILFYDGKVVAKPEEVKNV